MLQFYQFKLWIGFFYARRKDAPTEDTKHFIHFEAYGSMAALKMPYKWTEAVKIYTAVTFEKYGYLPYVITQVKQKILFFVTQKI